jgi:hypothetical protein
MTGSFALSRSLSEADIAPVAIAKALENKADNALSFTRHAIIDHFRPHRPSVITDLVGPHPLEPGLQPLSPSLLRAALTMPLPTAVSVSVSVPVEQPNSPKTPTLVQSLDPELPSSPETPAGEIHFAFPSSFVAAEVPPPRINISKAFPKMTSNGVPSGPTLRAKVCRCTAFTRSHSCSSHPATCLLHCPDADFVSSCLIPRTSSSSSQKSRLARASQPLPRRTPWPRPVPISLKRLKTSRHTQARLRSTLSTDRSSVSWSGWASSVRKRKNFPPSMPSRQSTTVVIRSGAGRGPSAMYVTRSSNRERG